jgi:hypothetical protein
LGVQPNSPASKAGLVSFFDFLVGVNGQLLFDNGSNANGDSDYFEDLDFVAIIKDNVDTELELCKCQKDGSELCLYFVSHIVDFIFFLSLNQYSGLEYKIQNTEIYIIDSYCQVGRSRVIGSNN